MQIQTYVYDEENQPHPFQQAHHVRLQGGFSNAVGFFSPFKQLPNTSQPNMHPMNYIHSGNIS